MNIGKQWPQAMLTPEIANMFVWSVYRNASGAREVNRLFPAGLPAAQWSEFPAAGYTQPVTGIIYRDEPCPVAGVPLGGIDTGCLDLEATGLFGYSSIFNHRSPRGGPLNKPFLGISVGGKTWVLTTGQTKPYDGGNGKYARGPRLQMEGIKLSQAIEYWGHYPIADLEFLTDAPVSVGLRVWSPFVPGDAAVSNTPGAVFEVHLRNTTDSPQSGTVAFSFPGFAGHKTTRENLQANWYVPIEENTLAKSEIVRKEVKSNPAGSWVVNLGWNMSYMLGVIDEVNSRIGGELGTDGSKWSAIEKSLPEITTEDDGGTSLAVDFKLEDGQERIVRFVLAWYAPQWQGNGLPETGGSTFTHIYADRFPGAVDVARFLTKECDSLLKREIAWQQVIYSAPELPGWLADSLINHLCYFAENCAWAQAKPPIGYWCKSEDGLFSMNESPRNCSQMECLPTSAVGNLPVSYFFPECALSTLQAEKAYQWTGTGGPSMVLGGGWDVARPMRGYQSIMNGSNYMVMLDRYWRVTRDKKFLKEFYDSAKMATEYAFNLRPEYGLSQIVVMQPEGTDIGLYADPEYSKYEIMFRIEGVDTEWFEDRRYYGYVVHAGGFRMAHAQMMRDWAKTMDDEEFVEKMDAYLDAGAKALEQYLWTGKYYMVYNEPETGRQLDVVFTPQLNGQYYARAHGLPEVFPKKNVDLVLEMVRKACEVSPLRIPPIYVSPEAKMWSDDAGYLTGNFVYVNSKVYMQAMTFMYEGQKDFGLELLRRCLENYACKCAYTWDGVNVMSGVASVAEGRVGGTDYFTSMALWGVPAALTGEDISGPCKPGGLVDRIIKAGKSNRYHISHS